MTFDPTRVDLAALTDRLSESLGTRRLPGEKLEGKTVLRDAVVEQLSCSALEAERVVDTLVARGFAHFTAHGVWELRRAES